MQKLALQQRNQHKLTPQQIQFISLLQTPEANLQQKVEKEILENPALVKEETTEAGMVEEPAATYSTTRIVHHTPTRNRPRNADFTDFIQNQKAENPSFRETLRQQVELLPLHPKEQHIARHLIGSLTAQGYLTRSLEVIVAEMAVLYNQATTLPNVEQVLQTIQNIGPPGIAARSLQESLLLQLQAQKPTATIQQAITIIAHYFEAFRKKHYTKIADKLNTSVQKLQSAVHTITKLNPYPIAPTSGGTANHILKPDFIVTSYQGKIRIALVERKLPRLRINTHYQALLEQHKHTKTPHSKEVVQFIQTKINRAKYFMQAMEQRKKTLLKVMTTLVRLQESFFKTGDPMQLVPIFLRNVAEKIRMDVSTVSRAIRQKAVQTPWGVYPLKYFFSRSVPTQGGNEVSSHIVKQMLAKLVDEEDKKAPYKDQELTSMLKKQGIQIARRTVAKYREQLNILPSRLRKGWS